MKFSNVIHPEILLGLRGAKIMTDYYNRVIGCIGRPISGKGWEVNDERVATMFTQDPNFFSHYILCKIFKDEGSHKIYYVPKDFAKALSTIDKGIPSEILKKGFVAYFQLGAGALSDDAGPIEGGYVCVDTADRFGFKTVDPNKLCFALSYMNVPPRSLHEGGYWPVTKFMCEIDESKLNALIAKVKSHADTTGAIKDGKLIFKPKNLNEDEEELRNAAFRCFINAAIYVHSSDPEVARLLPSKELSKAQKAKQQSYGFENQCYMPMTVLNKSYALGRTYSVGETNVETHMRFQRCGKDLSEVKLVWVAPHVRHFVNTRSIHDSQLRS